MTAPPVRTSRLRDSASAPAKRNSGSGCEDPLFGQAEH